MPGGSAHGLVKKIAVAPEYETRRVHADAVASGVVVALDARVTPRAATCLDAGAKVFVHLQQYERPASHHEPGMVGAALSSQDKSFSDICDGHHVNPISAGIVMRAKGHGHVA